MLKIKYNVDLKELKKFRFKHIPEQRNIREHYEYTEEDKDNIYPMLRCYIFCEDRTIHENVKGLDIIFDLIQAGFVEKSY